jgi:mannosylglycerate hydrolase
MRPRFDQVEQVAGEITGQSLKELAAAVDTRSPAGQNDDDFLAVVVFNPTASLRTELVDVEVEWPQDVDEFEFVSAHMGHVPFNTLETAGRELLNVSVDRETVASTLNLIQAGRAAGFAIQNVTFRKNDRQLHIFLRLSDTREPDLGVWERAQQDMQNYLADAEIEEFTITARTPTSARLVLLAQDVPAYGLRTFWARRSNGDKTRHSGAEDSSGPPYVIENEYFQVEASADDGTLTITDKRTGVVYRGLNRFVDGGDSGDEYNYNPPSDDLIVDTGQVEAIRLRRDPVEQFMEVRLALHVPRKLNRDRRSRSADKTALAIKTRVSLVMGVARIDVRTQVDNGDPPITDHRLRVHFPAPFRTDFASHDGHFEVVDRPVALQEHDSSWREAPRPEKPQRAFTSLSDGQTGLTIANRGLPEVEALQHAQGQAEIALTLLRCIGWLSREDLSTRKGHAGPMIATPEAQMPGSYDFDYAIIPHSGNWERAYLQAYAFNAPLRAVTTDLHRGNISPASSFISISHAAFIVTALKAAEDGSGWILRGSNLSAEPIDVQITCATKVERAARVNLAEEFEQELAVQNQNRVYITVRGHGIITVKFW